MQLSNTRFASDKKLSISVYTLRPSLCSIVLKSVKGEPYTVLSRLRIRKGKLRTHRIFNHIIIVSHFLPINGLQERPSGAVILHF